MIVTPPYRCWWCIGGDRLIDIAPDLERTSAASVPVKLASGVVDEVELLGIDIDRVRIAERQ